MRIGHAGFALVAKAFRPRVPLLVLVIAAYGPDIIEIGLWPFHIHNTEYSHSIISVAFFATVCAGIWFWISRSTGSSVTIWLIYASHWCADFFTGHKPTWPGGPTVGLDLYRFPVGEMVAELVVVLVCWLVYRGRSSLAGGPSIAHREAPVS